MTVTGSGSTNSDVESNETLGSMVTSISRRLWQRTPDDTEKQDIIQQINDDQKEICNLHKDWEFMFNIDDVAGYELDSTGSVDSSTVAKSVPNQFTDSFGTVYYAEKYTTGADVVTVPTSSITGFVQNSGFNPPTLTMYALIVGDTSGLPNLSDVKSTSEAITMTASSNTSTGVNIPTSPSSPSDVTFTFPEDAELSPSTDYWYVIKIVYADNTGTTIYPAARVETSSTTYQYISSWVAVTTGHLDYTISYNSGSFITEITMPADVAQLLDIYYGSTHMLETLDTKDGLVQPLNTFIVKKIDSSGRQVIQIRTELENVVRWDIEYKKKVPLLANDTDTPILPPDYRYVLRIKTNLEFIGMGYGIQTPTRETTLAQSYAIGIQTMEIYLRPEPGTFKWAGATGDYPITDRTYSKRLKNSNAGRNLKPRGSSRSSRRTR